MKNVKKKQISMSKPTLIIHYCHRTLPCYSYDNHFIYSSLYSYDNDIVALYKEITMVTVSPHLELRQIIFWSKKCVQKISEHWKSIRF